MLLAAGLTLLGLFIVTEQMISRGTIDGTSAWLATASSSFSAVTPTAITSGRFSPSDAVSQVSDRWAHPDLVGTSSADVWNRKAFADGSIAEIRL